MRSHERRFNMFFEPATLEALERLGVEDERSVAWEIREACKRYIALRAAPPSA